jgi:hypothetical protein
MPCAVSYVWKLESITVIGLSRNCVYFMQPHDCTQYTVKSVTGPYPETV